MTGSVGAGMNTINVACKNMEDITCFRCVFAIEDAWKATYEL